MSITVNAQEEYLKSTFQETVEYLNEEGIQYETHDVNNNDKKIIYDTPTERLILLFYNNLCEIVILSPDDNIVLHTYVELYNNSLVVKDETTWLDYSFDDYIIRVDLLQRDGIKKYFAYTTTEYYATMK
jgi:uncharacterized protein with WD repeat